MAGKRRADVPASARGARGSRRPGFLRRDRDRPDRPPKTWKSRLKRFFLWSTVTGVVVALLAVAGFVYLYKTTDIPNPNEDFLTNATYVYYEDGKSELGTYATQLRDSVSLDEMSDTLEDAVVAAEDQSFWTNNGIDTKGILRAALNNASGNSTQGASTITQQYVKILYLTQEQSYRRKVKEAILSLKIQREYSKEKVLAGYLNTIYFGRGAYGVEAAAQVYFDKTAAELNLRESAVLASVLNDPNDLDPADGKAARTALKERYSYVLGSMSDVGDITDEEAEKAVRKLPPFPEQEVEDAYAGQKGHALTLVKDELLRLRGEGGEPLFTEEQIDGGGLRVTTTLTQKAMNAAEEGVKEARPTDFPGAKDLHVAAASVEPGTGALRGFYGGQDYLDSQLNWAVEGGQAGSTFKPFAVAAGIKDGFSLRDTFDGNSPYETPDGLDFENQGDSGSSDQGSVSLTEATQNSVNTAFIDLTVSMDNGPQKVIDMAEAMGIPPAEARRNTPGIPSSSGGLKAETGVALGSATVSPINMANGYATIASGGLAADPYVIKTVEDAAGEVLYEHQVTEERAISEDIAADVSYAMQQVAVAGSGTEAQLDDREIAGKTGTATKDGGAVSSSWFAGFTPQLSTAVMYVRGPGNGQLDGWLPASDDGREGYFGGNYPAKTWNAIMTRDMEGVEPEEFPEPAYVDGEAPDDGHEPYVPPPPPPPPPSNDPPEQTPTETETLDPVVPEPEEPTEPTEPAEPSEPPEPPPGPEPTEPIEPPEPPVTPPSPPADGPTTPASRDPRDG